MPEFSKQGDPVLAQLIHHTRLATWALQTLGKSAVALTVPPLIGGVLAALNEEIGWIWAGSFVGMVLFLAYLSGASAPMPAEDVVDLALGDDEDDEDEAAVSPAPER